jgi:hypothetical protein
VVVARRVRVAVLVRSIGEASEEARLGLSTGLRRGHHARRVTNSRTRSEEAPSLQEPPVRSIASRSL